MIIDLSNSISRFRVRFAHRRSISYWARPSWFTALVLLVLFLACPKPGFADEASESALRVDECPSSEAEEKETDRLEEAAEHYDRGVVLYEEGDYVGAVDAFVASYCSKAHPSAYYNIAQSYERLLHYERAVTYFDRYIAEADKGAMNHRRAALRAEVLRALPAQLRIATVPPGAKVTVRNSSGITALGAANASAPIEVQQGEYTMRIEEPGYETVEQALITQIGQPYSYYFALVPKKGTLKVTATPNSGRIFLDDRLVAVGAYNESLAAGSYSVTVEAPGRASSTRKVDVVADQSSEVSVELEAPPASGRLTLLIASTLTLGLGGGVGSQFFEQSDTISAVASIATMGLGFGGAYFGIPERTTRGDAWYIIGSTALGAAEGAMVGSFFGCTDLLDGTESCGRLTRGSATLGALAGGTLAVFTHRRFELTTGNVALLSSGALWGTFAGLLFYSAFDSDSRIQEPILFSGLNLGVATAASIVVNSPVSLGRIAIIDLAGLGGIIAGLGLSNALDREDASEHLALLGMVSGLALGTFLTTDLDRDTTTKPPTFQPSVGAARDSAGQMVMTLDLGTAF